MSTRNNSRSLHRSRVTEQDCRSSSRDKKRNEKVQRDSPKRSSRLRSRKVRSQAHEIDSSLTDCCSAESWYRSQQNLYDRNQRSQSVHCGPKLKRSCSQASHSSGGSVDRKPHRDKEEKIRRRSPVRSRGKSLFSAETRRCNKEAASAQCKNEDKPDLRSVLNKLRGSPSSSSDRHRISKDSCSLLNVNLIPPQFPHLRERLLSFSLKDMDDKEHSSLQSDDKPHTVTSNTSVTDENEGVIHSDLDSNCENKIAVVVGTFCQDTAVDAVVTDDPVSLCQMSGSSEYQKNTVDTGYRFSSYEEMGDFECQENTMVTKDQVSLYQGSSEYQDYTTSTCDQVSLYQEKGHNDYQENTVAKNYITYCYQETGNIDYLENTVGTNNQVCLYQGAGSSEYQEKTVDTENKEVGSNEYQENIVDKENKEVGSNEYQENIVDKENKEIGSNEYQTVSTENQGAGNNEYQENTLDAKGQGAETIDHQENTAGTNGQVCLSQRKGHNEYQENTIVTSNQGTPLLVHSEVRDTDNQENAGNSAVHPTPGESEYQESVSHLESPTAGLQNNYDWKSDYERLDEYIRVYIEDQEECATQTEAQSSPMAEVACTAAQSDSDYRYEHTRVESAAQEETGNFTNASVDESCTPKMPDDLPVLDNTQDAVGSSLMESEPNFSTFNNKSDPVVENKAQNMNLDNFQSDSRDIFDVPVPLRSTKTAVRNDPVETAILNYVTSKANASSEETHPDGYGNTAFDLNSSEYAENDDEGQEPAMDLLHRRSVVESFEKNTKMILSKIQKAEMCPDVKNTTITTIQNKSKPNLKDTRMITSSMKNENVKNVTNTSLLKRRDSTSNTRATDQARMSNYGPTIVNVYKTAESVNQAQTPIWVYRHSNQIELKDKPDGRTNENICNRVIESGAALMKLGVCLTNENTYKVVEATNVSNWDYGRSNQFIEYNANKACSTENIHKAVEIAQVQIPIWEHKRLNDNAHKAVVHTPIWKSFNEKVSKGSESDTEYSLLDLDSLRNQQRLRNSGPVESYSWRGQCNNSTNNRQTYEHFETTSRQEQYIRHDVTTGNNVAGNRSKSTQPSLTFTNQAELPQNETQIVPYKEQLSATRVTEEGQSCNKVFSDPRAANISYQPVRYPRIEYPFNFNPIPPPPPPPSPVPPPPQYASRPRSYPYNPHRTPTSNFQAWGRNINPPTPAFKNWDRNDQGYKRTNVQYNTKRYYNNDFPSRNSAPAATISNNLDLMRDGERREQSNYGIKGDKMSSFLTAATQSTPKKDTSVQPKQPANEPEQSIGNYLPCPLQPQQENCNETPAPEVEQAVKSQKNNKASKSPIKKAKDSTSNKNKFKTLLQKHPKSQIENRKIPAQLKFIYDPPMKNKLPNVKIPKITKPKTDKETTEKVDTEAQGTSITEQQPLHTEESTAVVNEDKSPKIKNKRQPKKCSSSQPSSDTPCTKKRRKEIFDTVSVDNILQEVESSDRRVPNTRSRRKAVESSGQQNNSKKAVTFPEPVELKKSKKVQRQPKISDPQPANSESETTFSYQVDSSRESTGNTPHNKLQVTLVKIQMPTDKEGETSNGTTSSSHAETSTTDAYDEILPVTAPAESSMSTIDESELNEASNETDSLPNTLAQTSITNVEASNEINSLTVTPVAQTSSTVNESIDNFTVAHIQNLMSAINEFEDIQATSIETKILPQQINNAVLATHNIMPDGLLGVASQAMQKLSKPAQKCKALLELVTVVKAQQNPNRVSYKYCEDTESFLKNGIETLNAAEGFPDEETKLMQIITGAALRNIALIILASSTMD